MKKRREEGGKGRGRRGEEAVLSSGTSLPSLVIVVRGFGGTLGFASYMPTTGPSIKGQSQLGALGCRETFQRWSAAKVGQWHLSPVLFLFLLHRC